MARLGKRKVEALDRLLRASKKAVKADRSKTRESFQKLQFPPVKMKATEAAKNEQQRKDRRRWREAREAEAVQVQVLDHLAVGADLAHAQEASQDVSVCKVSLYQIITLGI